MSISRTGSRWKRLKLGSVSIAESVWSGGVVSTERGRRHIIGVDVIVLEYCSLVDSIMVREVTYQTLIRLSEIECCPLLF